MAGNGSGIYEAKRTMPNGVAIKVAMSRALGSIDSACIGCMLTTPRYITSVREDEEEWRTLPACDFCFELLKKIGVDKNTKLPGLEIKLPWTVDANKDSPYSAGEFTIMRQAPDGTAFKVIMGRTSGDAAESEDCFCCRLPTTRFIVAQRDGEGRWRRISACDTCFGLIGQIGGVTGTEWHGV